MTNSGDCRRYGRCWIASGHRDGCYKSVIILTTMTPVELLILYLYAALVYWLDVLADLIRSLLP